MARLMIDGREVSCEDFYIIQDADPIVEIWQFDNPNYSQGSLSLISSMRCPVYSCSLLNGRFSCADFPISYSKKYFISYMNNLFWVSKEKDVFKFNLPGADLLKNSICKSENLKSLSDIKHYVKNIVRIYKNSEKNIT